MVSVYAPVLPTVNWPVCDLVNATSTPTVTATGPSTALLLAGFGSPGVTTYAVLVTAGCAAVPSSTVSVAALVAPGAIGPALAQLTTWATAVHDQPVPAPLVYDTPAGSVSVSVMAPVLAPEPTLLTDSV